MEAVRLLLMLGNAIANHVDDQGWSPLLVASDNGHTQAVDMLVELGGADVQAILPSGTTALDLALRHDHLDTAALLVVHGCEPTLEDHPAGSAWLVTSNGARPLITTSTSCWTVLLPALLPLALL